MLALNKSISDSNIFKNLVKLDKDISQRVLSYERLQSYLTDKYGK